MKVRTITIALIALSLVAIIGNAVVVREVAPRLANGSGTATAGTGAKAMTEQIAPDSRRGLAVGSTRSGRDPVAVRALVQRPVSLVGRLAPLAQADDPRWR